MESKARHKSTLLAFFDLESYPSGEEIFAFMVIAEIARREGKFASLHLVFVPKGEMDPNCTSRGKDVDVDRIAYRISANIAMMPSIAGYTICGSRFEALRMISAWEGPIFPIGYSVAATNCAKDEGRWGSGSIYRLLDESRARCDVPPALTVPRQATEYVAGWLKKLAASRLLITVTLAKEGMPITDRQIEPHRVQFVSGFDASAYFVAFIADEDLSAGSLPKGLRHIPIFPGAGAFSPLRLALYREAHLNLIEVPASVGLCHADDQMRCLYFGTDVAGVRSLVAKRFFWVDGYDSVEVLEGCRQVEVATNCLRISRNAIHAETAVKMSIDAFFKRALDFHRGGRIDNAIKIYSGILKVNPRHAGALGMLGVSAMMLGEAERALSLIRHAVALDGGEPAHHYNLGNVLMLLSHEEEAVASYRNVLTIDGHIYSAWEKLASIYYRRGNFQEAAACYLEALKGPQRSSRVLFEGARCLAELERHEEAAKLYLEAGRRYLDRIRDEDFANAMGGFFWREPFLPRNASFLSD